MRSWRRMVRWWRDVGRDDSAVVFVLACIGALWCAAMLLWGY